MVEDGKVVGLIEQTEPRTGLNFGERREVPAFDSLPGPVTDFRGPYADGPPPSELRVHAPDLSDLGFAEVRRGVVIWWTLVSSVLLALLRRRWAVIRGREYPSWWDTASEGAVDAFEKLGPAFVKLGQIMASSPGVFPEPLADACQRTLDEVPPFDGATRRRQIVAEDLGRPPEELFRFFDDKPLSSASIGQVHACVLPDGREAVLKLQRPGIRQLMTIDLRIMWRIARLAESGTGCRRLDPVAIIEDPPRSTSRSSCPARGQAPGRVPGQDRRLRRQREHHRARGVLGLLRAPDHLHAAHDRAPRSTSSRRWPARASTAS